MGSSYCTPQSTKRLGCFHNQVTKPSRKTGFIAGDIPVRITDDESSLQESRHCRQPVCETWIFIAKPEVLYIEYRRQKCELSHEFAMAYIDVFSHVCNGRFSLIVGTYKGTLV